MQRQRPKYIGCESRAVRAAKTENRLVRGSHGQQPAHEATQIGHGNSAREHRVTMSLVASVVRGRHTRVGGWRVVIVLRAIRVLMARRAHARRANSGSAFTADKRVIVMSQQPT